MIKDLKVGDIIFNGPHNKPRKFKYLGKFPYKFLGLTKDSSKNDEFLYKFRDSDYPGCVIGWKSLKDIPNDYAVLTELGRILYE